jgi:hypothetical protein
LYFIPVFVDPLEQYRVKEERIDGKENYTEKEKSSNKEKGSDKRKRPDKIYRSSD